MPPTELPTLAPTATPKSMSNRLMTMKFMQRGVASAGSSPATTPQTDNEGSAKRRKTSHKSTPVESKPLYDEKAVQAALEEEEKKREAAIERRAAELGDEHWVLRDEQLSSRNTKHRGALNIVQVGFAQIDSGALSGDDDRVTGLKGRLQFNMKEQKSKKHDSSSESGSESSESESDSDGSASPAYRGDSRGRSRPSEGTPSGHKRPRSSLSKRQEEERAKVREDAAKRRKKEVKLNTLTSISGGGAQSASLAGRPPVKCYGCGKTGHISKDCPSRRRSGG